MATEEQLLKCTLKQNETVTIGRSEVCELVIKSRFLSGKHCEVAMTKEAHIGEEKQRPKYTVCDTSSNGTWLLKAENMGGQNATRGRIYINAVSAKKAKKLVKGTLEELNPGDCIFLLAPSHEEFMKFQFVLMKNEDDNCGLQQLSDSVQLAEKSKSPESVSEVASKRTWNSAIEKCNSAIDGLKKARMESVEKYLDDQPSTSKAALRAHAERMKKEAEKIATTQQPNEPINVENIATQQPNEPINVENIATQQPNEPINVENIATQQPNEPVNVENIAKPPPLLLNESHEECPMCRNLFPISVLLVHCDECTDQSDDVIILDDETDGKRNNDVPERQPYIVKSLSAAARPTLDPAVPKPGSGDNDDVVELEQCIYCLKDFPLSKLVAHVNSCGYNTEEVMEQCPHCSKMFPLSEFYMHLLKEQQLMKQSAAANYLALMEASEAKLITNTEEFDCMICYVGVEPGEGVILKGCLHQFCKECLRQHVKLGEDAEVKCPHQDENYSCGAVISEREIREIVSEEELQQLHRRGLRLAENSSGNSFHCRTANCEGFCFLEDKVNEFLCPICSKVNCVLCKAIHENMDCRQYQDELVWNEEDDKDAKATRKMLQDLVRKGKAMHCPKCRIIVQKREGCDWISCAMCKTEICWATKGPRWGPKGHGDTSGGCMCNTRGKKCHPKCGNCH